MPLYEYVCEACRREFELLRPMNEADAPTACLSCGGTRIRRKLSVFHAQSDGKSVAGTNAPSCSDCAGGSCGSCGLG
ncbi:MAG: zinc ribbon domain-containing protein [Anaerolineales bacterium]|nr:zinc ribbon domain-containing protein [Anaerolineales bacterium]